MKKSGYTEERIAFALKQAETGTPVVEVIRRMGILEQTFYRWKKVYGGLGVGELRRVKQLEDWKLDEGEKHGSRKGSSRRWVLPIGR